MFLSDFKKEFKKKKKKKEFTSFITILEFQNWKGVNFAFPD